MIDEFEPAEVSGKCSYGPLELQWSALANADGELIIGSIDIDQWAVPGFTEQQIKVAYDILEAGMTTIGSSVNELIEIDYNYKRI